MSVQVLEATAALREAVKLYREVMLNYPGNFNADIEAALPEALRESLKEVKTIECLGLPRKVKHALIRNGIFLLDDLLTLSEFDLLSMQGLWRPSLKHIRDALRLNKYPPLPMGKWLTKRSKGYVGVDFPILIKVKNG